MCLNKKCVKGMQVHKQGWGEEMHHTRHTLLNSCKEAGFTGVEGGYNLRTGQIHAECRVGVHPLNPV